MTTIERERQVSLDRVFDRVSDEANAIFAESFSTQIFDRLFGRGEQQLRKVVDHHAIDLFRHGAVEASEAGLDVRDLDAVDFRGRESARQSRIRVAVDEDPVGPCFRQSFAESDQHLARLGRVPARADAKSVRRTIELEFVPEDFVHVRAEMLIGVDDDVVAISRLQLAQQRRHLDDLRASS